MSDPTTHLDGIVHGETQRAGPGVDLTLAAVETITAPGRVDFGGGELTDAETAPVETAKRSPDDDYGWWTLTAGQYLIRHNEKLDAPDPYLLQPRQALLTRGVSHPTIRVTGLGPIPLTVGGAGVRLKENARVSTLFVGPG